MDPDRFEAALDHVIAAHDRKVCAEIDAGACRTSSDYRRMHDARDTYEAREAFLAEVFAPPPPAPAPVPVVAGFEEQVRGRTRGRPLVWRRWIEIRLRWRGVAYTFTADADALALDSGAVEAGDDSELCAPDFDPLSPGHSAHLRGIEYTTTDPGPAELVRLAVETCRAVARRLLAHGVDHFTARRTWPLGVPAFSEIVRGEPTEASAA